MVVEIDGDIRPLVEPPRAAGRDAVHWDGVRLYVTADWDVTDVVRDALADVRRRGAPARSPAPSRWRRSSSAPGARAARPRRSSSTRRTPRRCSGPRWPHGSRPAATAGCPGEPDERGHRPRGLGPHPRPRLPALPRPAPRRARRGADGRAAQHPTGARAAPQRLGQGPADRLRAARLRARHRLHRSRLAAPRDDHQRRSVHPGRHPAHLRRVPGLRQPARRPAGGLRRPRDPLHRPPHRAWSASTWPRRSPATPTSSPRRSRRPPCSR